MKKTIVTTALVVVLTTVALLIFVRLTSKKTTEELNFADAVKGNFEISVSNAGELVAENSVEIKGPDIVGNRRFRSAGIKIVDLVPEGTMVKKGDYIATLDRSTFENTLKDETDNLKTIQTELNMKILDTAVTLSSLRDDIKNQTFAVEEAGITVDQSKYEPPATQRHAELELDKSKRLLLQQKKLYSLRVAQTQSEIRTLKTTLSEQQRKVTDLQNILKGFTITAPSAGMVIYYKDRLGVKNKVGSILNPWDPVVATLPNLSTMVSKVYVSEIDVSKIKPGDPVQMTIDAFRGRSFKGEVTSIANIGEQLSNSDSKVFEVLIKLAGYDPSLRPSMTTSNKIITQTFDNVVYVPIESVHTGRDSIPYVYTKEGTKQVVVLGASNDKNIIIEQGLPAGTPVWLSTPSDPEKYTLAGNDLIPVIREREKEKRQQQESLRKDNNLLTESEQTRKSPVSGSTGKVTSGASVTAGGN